jgi:hypothetical protein
VIRSDIRTFFRRLPGLFRNDYSAVMLVIANLYPVIDMLWKGEPIGSILVIYWIQMMIIGFIGGFFNTAAVAVLFVLPVKLSLDLLGHFAEHGMLGFDDDEAQGSSQQSKSE